MCGIAGFIGSQITASQPIANEMASALHHRGPDDHGVWIEHNNLLTLIHTRLSILDLSTAGHQPMHSSSQQYALVFNGEIYNHLSLRNELSQNGITTWKGHSDTETLLAGIEVWGLKKTLQKAVGMFAIALWDTIEQTLYLARDRMGEKPLYYGLQNGIFMFASELKALKKHPAFASKINREAVALQLRYSYIPEPYSIYEDIFKLAPGYILTFHPHTQKMESFAYWSLSKTIAQGQLTPFKGSDADITSELEKVLRNAVTSQMISDVPLGAFLSGGIDSSLVTALLQSQSSRPIKTFTIGFNEEGYNEAQYAQAVAHHLQTEHTEFYVSNRDALNVIPLLPTLYDEPFSDSSQIPTFLVSQMTKHHVTVGLSGDGADELFGGYNRYLWANKIWKKIDFLPQNTRNTLASLISLTPADSMNTKFLALSHYLPKRFRYKNIGDKLHKLADILTSPSKEDVYLALVAQWKFSEHTVIGVDEPNTIRDRLLEHQGLDFISQMMATDTITYLPGDILTKVDRAAMGVSLETRAPFLDHRVVEAAWKLPLSMKIRDGKGKWILRQILSQHIPKEMIERPKMGFGAPIDSWLRGPLREWAETLLNEDRLRREGFLNPIPIRKKWEEHLSKKHNWQYQLWNVLMFQAWLEENQ